MIISLKELNKYIPHKKLDASIKDDINNLGFEVESIEKFGDVQGIKFAKILEVEKNPNADSLYIAKLQTNDSIIQVQTSASNAQKGYFTVVFVVGSRLGDIVFEAKEMAGVVSQGMMAGYDELGFNPDTLPYDKDGIILIDDPEITVDTDPVEYFMLNDYVIDISTYANRPETNSYFVLAKELAAYYRTDFVFNKVEKAEGYHFKTKTRAVKKEAQELSIIEAKITNIKTSIQDVLFLSKHGYTATGLYPNDIATYMLILMGTPTQVYDKSKIKGNLYCLEHSGEVEIIGNKKVTLDENLVIKDADENILSIASVIGTEYAKITNETKEAIFAMGRFDAPSIRRAAKQIKVDTPLSIQGGKWINRVMIHWSMNYLANKVIKDDHAVSKIVGLPRLRKGKSIVQNRTKLAAYSNWFIKDLKRYKEVENLLMKMGYSIDKNRIVAPSYREDIEFYEDIIEEYFRFFGYKNFGPVEPFLQGTTIQKSKSYKADFQAMGYSEVRTYSLISEELNKLNPFNFKESVKLQTFVSKEREVIRDSIITSLLEVADYNLKRNVTDINIFEEGMINNNVYVYGLLTSNKTFSELKKDVVNFLKTDNLKFIPYKDNENVHPNVSAKIYENDCFIGWIGKVHPALSDLNVWVAEFKNINLKDKNIVFEEYDYSPFKTLDLTFEIDAKDHVYKKVDEILNVSSVYKVEQIDDYKHDDKRNVTLRITGTNEQIELIHNKFNK